MKEDINIMNQIVDQAGTNRSGAGRFIRTDRPTPAPAGNFCPAGVGDRQRAAGIRTHRPGFTIMELMVVIAIIGALSAIAIPNLVGFLRNRDVNGTVQETLSMVSKARMRAVTRNSPTRVVFGNQGVEAFIMDSNGNWQAWDLHQIPFGVDFSVAFGGNNEVVFTARGLPDLAAGFNGGMITVKNSRISRTIEITPVGQLRTG